MTSYTTTQIPNSTSGLVLIASDSGAVILVALAPKAENGLIERKAYSVDSTPSSFSNSYLIPPTNKIEDFSETLSSFYEELASKQEPLGDDFSQVLNENIWELYES